MMPEEKKAPFLHTPRDQVTWNWWRENPIEIILMVLILVFFVATPRDGCGVTPPGDTDQATPNTAPRHE